MTKTYSDSLARFRELIKQNNRRVESPKREKERKDLFDWFVYNCPSHDGPEKARKFSDFGVKTNYDFKKLKEQILDVISLKKDETYRYCDSGTKMEALLDEIERLYSSRRKPIIFFSKGTYGEIDSLYIRIRHSLAHDNYFKVKDYYYLWNETGSEGRTKKLGSFMALKYSDLKSIYNVLSDFRGNA